jgi:hypothetical protein
MILFFMMYGVRWKNHLIITIKKVIKDFFAENNIVHHADSRNIIFFV